MCGGGLRQAPKSMPLLTLSDIDRQGALGAFSRFYPKLLVHFQISPAHAFFGAGFPFRFHVLFIISSK